MAFIQLRVSLYGTHGIWLGLHFIERNNFLEIEFLHCKFFCRRTHDNLSCSILGHIKAAVFDESLYTTDSSSLTKVR